MFNFLLLPIWLKETFLLIAIVIAALIVAKLVSWLLEFLEKVWLSSEKFQLYQKLIR